MSIMFPHNCDMFAGNRGHLTKMMAASQQENRQLVTALSQPAVVPTVAPKKKQREDELEELSLLTQGM